MNLIRALLLIIMSLAITVSDTAYGQNTPEEKGLNAITLNVLKGQVGFLASDWMEGREAGEKGEYIASDYIASMLQLYGVKPWGDIIAGTGNERTYFQNFVLLKLIAGDEPVVNVRSSVDNTLRSVSLTNNVDFVMRNPFQNFDIEGPVVYTGYDIDKKSKNGIKESDVRGKFIFRISRIPNSKDRGAYLISERETENSLRKMGALGIIEFTPERNVVGSPSREFLNTSPAERQQDSEIAEVRYTIPGRMVHDNFLRIVISERAANELLYGTGINIDDEIKKEGSGSAPVTLIGKSIYIKTSVEIVRIPVRNVLGIIEGNNPEKAIILGAHYDHMGMRDGSIWNGADDNASGTAGVMTLAKAIIETGSKPENTIIIALWTAEEKGLLGSRYYVQNPAYPLRNTILNVNFDMISRYVSDNEPNKVTMTYTSSQQGFRNLTRDNLQKYGIDLDVTYQPSDNPPGGSDHRSFVSAGIPIMRFKPGHREEYHTPMDETHTLDWDIMEKIIRISFLNVWKIANSE
jgi:hypothetical protein